ncbi:MAG: hypothetical protein CM15mP120_24470 [Pseudomonadota bacterium]|nr:MAG: hypothetical protein CM15mP120_24470 [Pseudomonadota bacterium]
MAKSAAVFGSPMDEQRGVPARMNGSTPPAFKGPRSLPGGENYKGTAQTLPSDKFRNSQEIFVGNDPLWFNRPLERVSKKPQPSPHFPRPEPQKGGPKPELAKLFSPELGKKPTESSIANFLKIFGDDYSRR